MVPSGSKHTRNLGGQLDVEDLCVQNLCISRCEIS
jgi:hypothetical protein